MGELETGSWIKVAPEAVVALESQAGLILGAKSSKVWAGTARGQQAADFPIWMEAVGQ